MLLGRGATHLGPALSSSNGPAATHCRSDSHTPRPGSHRVLHDRAGPQPQVQLLPLQLPPRQPRQGGDKHAGWGAAWGGGGRGRLGGGQIVWGRRLFWRRVSLRSWAGGGMGPLPGKPRIANPQTAARNPRPRNAPTPLRPPTPPQPSTACAPACVTGRTSSSWAAAGAASASSRRAPSRAAA